MPHLLRCPALEKQCCLKEKMAANVKAVKFCRTLAKHLKIRWWTGKKKNAESINIPFFFFYTDNEPPVFITPNNVSSASVDAGRADSIIVWAPPLSATDIVDGLNPSTSITCVDDLGVSVASGDRYAVGVTTVYCSVRDAALNLQTTQFVITVLGTWFVPGFF